MTNRHSMETIPLTRARADLGPLARWVGSTRSRIALSSRGHVAAILISPAARPGGIAWIDAYESTQKSVADCVVGDIPMIRLSLTGQLLFSASPSPGSRPPTCPTTAPSSATSPYA